MGSRSSFRLTPQTHGRWDWSCTPLGVKLHVGTTIDIAQWRETVQMKTPKNMTNCTAHAYTRKREILDKR